MTKVLPGRVGRSIFVYSCFSSRGDRSFDPPPHPLFNSPVGVPAMRDRPGTTEMPPERAAKTLTLKSWRFNLRWITHDRPAGFLFVPCFRHRWGWSTCEESRTIWMSCGLVMCSRVGFMLSSATENARQVCVCVYVCSCTVQATCWEVRTSGV